MSYCWGIEWCKICGSMNCQLLNVYVLTNIKMEKHFDYKGHIYESGLIHTVYILVTQVSIMGLVFTYKFLHKNKDHII